MISDAGRSNRTARASSSVSTEPKWRELKRPVLGSTRACSCSRGTWSARWIRKSGASANGISARFTSQKAATPIPSEARTNSVDSITAENSPVSAGRWPRAR